ncbi:DNA-binding MarR family transcriptional regulator [Isoptericola sp. CG 20/1183]|uniref:DNA-binding MarR family transcriptional regulator n=1 Tax=Isoptericola halotolerans TaxID=300560 RepID=A0ABX5EIH6_9MICO|nr:MULTISPECIES: MarR family transcriptional regulator [Isoptericola]MCK0118253.1 MarR family transcriptional regulator [Isoptericola sp. S6320L]PRZ09419.1 DNA-binding MarR family transcriptional regulator [Isoptericola sp. CG 20/1183]PRZ10220.1 DNA-binding MarR family transcriptional regulator [Isoptericola halotolerans]
MTQASSGSSPYWYDTADAEARGLLDAVRGFRRADESMRQRASRDMDMNVIDLRALRYVIESEQSGTPVTPRMLTAQLDISTAATTKLVDRLCRSGHLERQPHPTDRRSVVVRATGGAHHEVRERLGSMHSRMLEIARAVPASARPAVRDFLEAMAAELAREHDDAATHVVTDAPEGRAAGAPGTAPAPVD